MSPTVDTTDEKVPEPPKAKAPAADLNTIMKQAADLKTAQMKDKRRWGLVDKARRVIKPTDCSAPTTGSSS